MINNFEIDKYGNLKRTSENLKDKKGEYISSDNESEEIGKTSNDQRNGRIRKKSFFLDYINVNIGYSLVVPLLLGVIIGLGLDSRFETKPFFTVLFIFLGMVSSFYNLFKLIK